MSWCKYINHIKNSIGITSAKKTSSGSRSTSTKGIPVEAGLATLDLQTMNLMSQKDLQTNVLARARRDTQEEDEMFILGAQNQTLCSKLKEMQNQCKLLARFIHTKTDNLLTCNKKASILEDSKTQKPVFKIELNSIPGHQNIEFYLLANSLYKSSVFKKGVTEIEFQSLGDKATRAEQWIKMNRLVLRTTKKDMAMPAKRKDIRLKIFIDDFEIFNTKVDPLIAAINPLHKEYEFNLTKLLDKAKKSSTLCFNSPEIIDNWKEEARKSLKETEGIDAEKSGLYVSENASGDKQQLKAKILRYQQSIQKRSIKLESKRNTLMKLEKELTWGAGAGCALKEKIDTLKIAISGTKDNLEIIGMFGSPQEPETGRDGACTELEIKFGTDLAKAIDQENNAVIGSAYVWEDIPEGTTLSNFEYLQLRKKGDCIENTPMNIGGLSGWFSGGKEYQASELHRWSISEVTVWANNREVYHRSGLGINFNRKESLVWKDTSFRSNEKWIKAQQSSACNTTQ